MQTPTFEVLGFARNNSLIADHLDAIENLLPDAELHDCPQQDMSFCKYAFLSAEEVGYEGKATIARINGHEDRLKSGYEKRYNKDAEECEYLCRWFDAEKVEPPNAKCIAVVLYDREQLAKEGIEINADYGIVTAQAEPIMGISPMTPETIVRNAMGPEFGGNGTAFDREYHDIAVRFWSDWAIVR